MITLQGQVVKIERAGWDSVYLHVFIPEYSRSLDGTRVFKETVVFRELDGELDVLGGVVVGDSLTLSEDEDTYYDEGELIQSTTYSIVSKNS